jgi:hypothetical protein
MSIRLFDLENRAAEAQRLGIPEEHLPLDLYRIPGSPEEHSALARRVETAQRERHWTPQPEPGLLAGIRQNPASRRWAKRVFAAVGLFAVTQYHALWMPYLLWIWAAVAVGLVLWIACFAMLIRSVWFLRPEDKP